MDNQLDELLASLAARCHVCNYVLILMVFFYFMNGDK